MQSHLIDSVSVRKPMPLRFQMGDKLVLSGKTTARDTARAPIDVTLEARRCSVSIGNVSCQVAFPSIVLGTVLVGTVMTVSITVQNGMRGLMRLK